MALNPYRDWLQMDDEEPPPDHYRLLGLATFEEDQSKIHAAYGSRMEAVRRYQVGAHMELAQRVIGELSAAYAQLTHPDQKRQYDESLRGTNHRQATPDLLQRARAEGATVCGSCFELVPSPEDAATQVTVEPAALTSDYISIRQRRFLFWIELSAHSSEASPVPELGTCISRSGALWMAALLTGIPLVCNLAAGLAGLPGTEMTSLLMLAACAVVLGAVAMFYRPRYTSPLDAGWEFVVPHLLKSAPSSGADAFIAGLALASEGRGDRRRRRKPLVDVLAAFRMRSNIEPTLHGFESIVERLWLADLIAQGDTDTIIESMRRTMLRCLSAEAPMAMLDLAAQNGAILAKVSFEARMILKWHLFIVGEKCGLSVSDVMGLKYASRTLAILLDAETKATANSVSHAFALIQCAGEGGTHPSVRTAIQSATASGRRFELRIPDAIAWSEDGRTMISEQGLHFHGHRLNSPPAIYVEPIERFVQTGWTHQRSDGQRDRRFKDNPPIGYTEVVGHILNVNSHQIRFNQGLGSDSKAKAARMAEVVFACSRLLFEQIRPRAARLAVGRGARSVSSLLRNFVVRCPHCQRTMPMEVGQIATQSDAGH